VIWFARPILLEKLVVRKTSGLRNTLLLLLGATCLIAGGHSNQLHAAVAPSTFVRVASGDEPASATFAGKIVSQNGDRFILRDDANEVWYQLDDQAQAQRHFGKDVVVTGVLDGRSDMIHVRNIVEVKP
jgi:uncharacterized protein YdeI (BOF family)